MHDVVGGHLSRSAEAASALAADEGTLSVLAAMAGAIEAAFRAGGKLLIAGNGGSAADAQHLAAEFVSRLYIDRGPLAALALTESGPILTACGNDYGFETVFARQVQALGRAGDVLLGLSTSGTSRNVLLAAEAARRAGMQAFGFSGRLPAHMAAACDLVFCAPSPDAQIVQQLHIQAGHAVIAAVERAMFQPSA